MKYKSISFGLVLSAISSVVIASETKEEFNDEKYGALSIMCKDLRNLTYSKLDHPFDFNALSRTLKGFYQ